MNELDDQKLNDRGFAFADLLGRDRWQTIWTPAFTSLTLVGALTVSGRYRIVGRSVQFQVSFSAATSIASTAGTTYLALPIAAQGIAGIATMTNDTTNVAVGTCHVDTATSRCYLPAQTASGNVFTICGSYEV